MLPHALALAAGRQPDRQRDRPDPGRRVRQHQHERRRMLAQNAQEPEDRRGRGRVHEREEPARGGVRVDVHPLADHHPHLVPQAVILVGLAQKINGQRNRREDDHQDQEERDKPTPEPGRAGP